METQSDCDTNLEHCCVEYLKGEKGCKGEPGQSIRGEKGETGEKGCRGPVGPMGNEGPAPSIRNVYNILDKKNSEKIELYLCKSNNNFLFTKSIKLESNSIIIDLDKFINCNDFAYNFITCEDLSITDKIDLAYSKITVNLTLGGDLSSSYNQPFYKFIDGENKTTYDNSIISYQTVALEINTDSSLDFSNSIYLSISLSLSD